MLLTITHNIVPRSLAEATAHEFGYRQLPCRTFISVGTCPFRERCDYLHDPRILVRNAKTKTRKRNEEDNIEDGFFWPPLSIENSRRRVDNHGQPLVVQNYNIPVPKNDEYFFHDSAIYSMWNYFVDFCMKNADGSLEPMQESLSLEILFRNQFIKKKRLPIFCLMAHGEVLLNENRDNTYGFGGVDGGISNGNGGVVDMGMGVISGITNRMRDNTPSTMENSLIHRSPMTAFSVFSPPQSRPQSLLSSSPPSLPPSVSSSNLSHLYTRHDYR